MPDHVMFNDVEKKYISEKNYITSKPFSFIFR